MIFFRVEDKNNGIAAPKRMLGCCKHPNKTKFWAVVIGHNK